MAQIGTSDDSRRLNHVDCRVIDIVTVADARRGLSPSPSCRRSTPFWTLEPLGVSRTMIDARRRSGYSLHCTPGVYTHSTRSLQPAGPEPAAVSGAGIRPLRAPTRSAENIVLPSRVRAVLPAFA